MNRRIIPIAIAVIGGLTFLSGVIVAGLLNLVKRPEASVRVFLMGDGVSCALCGQKTPDGYYNVERILQSVARRGAVAT